MGRFACVLVSVLVFAAPAAAQLRAELVSSGFTAPLAVVQDPTHPNVQFVVEQGGRIRALVNGAIATADFLNLSGAITSGGERGLLGLAFAPDYATSRRFFVNFTDPSGNTVVARFLRDATNPLIADPTSRFDLVWPDGQAFITQPFENHKGGNLLFGPDGYLYVGMGDGGSGGDPLNNAQNPQSLLGKFLRIDVAVPLNHPTGYEVPPTNPFVGRADVLPEIWSVGVRNPWRWSFDDPSRGGTGALVIGDVGQSAFEEIDYEPAGMGGRNYGWRIREGAHDFDTSQPAFSLPLTEPIYDYSHAVGNSITGGFVYRGQALGSEYTGRYFFADFVNSRVWSLALTVDPLTREASASNLVEHTSALGAAAHGVSSFGVDSHGELLIVSYTGGSIYRLVLGFILNGSFTNGLREWFTWATPTPLFFVGGASDGVVRFFRQPSPPGASNQAVLFQPTNISVPAQTSLSARVDLGNSSHVRKRLSVVLHDLDFSDLAVCTFWLPPHAPLRTYEIRARTTLSWSNVTISFYAATEGSDGGFYEVDNASLDFSSSSIVGTACVDPTAPAPESDDDGPDLVTNGGFDNGLGSWFLWGAITPAVSNGVLIAGRPAGDTAGALVQPTMRSLHEGSVVTATFDLGNNSPTRKRVTVLVHDLDFTDLAACTFWLLPSQPLSTYTMHAFTTTHWHNATISVYPVTIDDAPWMLLDNVTLRTTPSQPIVGTECHEPLLPAMCCSAMLAAPCASPDSLPPFCSWWSRRRISGLTRNRGRRSGLTTSPRSPRS